MLVIFPGALGDFVCFLPALKRLSTAGRVELLARTEYGGILPENVKCRSLERREVSQLFTTEADKDPGLRQFFGSFDAIYSWMGSGTQEFVRNLHSLCPGDVRLFPFAPTESNVHMADYYLSCVPGGYCLDGVPFLSVRPDAQAWAESYWNRSRLGGHRVLAMAPGSGAKEKNWPLARYQAVAEWWQARGGRVIVILGPAEDGLIMDGFSKETLIMRRTDLPRVAALLSRCDVVLGNDSGITHLAAALAVETIAVFGPSDPRQWRPRGAPVTIATLHVACSPCNRSTMKSCPHRTCLNSLAARDVMKFLETSMAERETRKSEKTAP